MTMPTGGKRDRFIVEAFHRALSDHLEALGWMDLDDAHSPIVIVDGFPDDPGSVAPNTLAISMGDLDVFPSELGHHAGDFDMVMFCDFYGETDAISRQMAGDILEWCMAVEYLPVRDYEDPEEPVLFQVEVLDDANAREPAVNQSFEKHWRVVSVSLIDYRPFLTPGESPGESP